LNYLGRWIVI